MLYLTLLLVIAYFICSLHDTPPYRANFDVLNELIIGGHEQVFLGFSLEYFVRKCFLETPVRRMINENQHKSQTVVPGNNL